MMRSIFRASFTAILALLTVFGMSSCRRVYLHFTQGEAVTFTAASAGSAASKAAYSGYVSGGYERIDWEDGDLIRIYCAQASVPETKYADYVILDGTVGSDGRVSSATIMPSGEASLCWGEENVKHVFYAMYPSPDATGEGDLTGSIATCIIPSDQAPLELKAGSDADFVVTPDLSTSEYMVARRSIVNNSEADGNVNYGSVFLSFKPITTAIEFTITNNYSGQGDLNIKNVQLISAGHDIAGSFTANLGSASFGEDGSGYPVCHSAQDGSIVKIDLTDIPGYDYSGNAEVNGSKNYIAVPYDKTLRFTFFLKPDYDGSNKAIDVNDLTFKIERADEENTWISTKLAYNDALKTGVPFPCHKKSSVKGILVPEGAQWMVKYTPEVNPWSAEDGPDVESQPELFPAPFVTSWETGYTTNKDMIRYNYNLDVGGQLEFGHEGTSNTSAFPDGKSTINITSSREYNHSTPRSVEWHLEYLDVESGEWKMVKANTKIGGLVTVSPLVSSLEDIETTEGEITISVDAAAANPSTSHQGLLRGAAPQGDTNHPYDLSMHDIHGKAYAAGKARTANCYVISAPGVYAFPLVYGNAIDYSAALAGGINIPAYNPGGESPSTATYLSKFINAKGSPIVEPYIERDLEAGSISGWSAFPLWQDVSSASAIIADGGCTVLTAAQASGKGLTACNCGYVMFEVSAETITQGNAIIAVKDGSGIVWSWHIWVTDRDLNAVSLPGSGLTMLPVNLGWVDNNVTSNFISYNGASVRFRVVQGGSGAIKEFTVSRKAEDTSSSTDGTSPYWQWGRKDPFIRSCPAGTAHSGYTTFTPSVAASTIQYAITRPDVFVMYNGATWYTGATYRNLWSALDDADGISASGYSAKPYKTIYDPCPPGFQVPQGNAFTGLDITTANSVLQRSGLRNGAAAGAASLDDHAYYWTAVTNSSSDCESISFCFNTTSWCQTLPGRILHGFSIRPSGM